MSGNVPTIDALMQEQAALRGEEVAVAFQDRRLTYGRLDERAGSLARVLRGQGVGPETVVGLCLEKSIDLIVGLAGILRAGGAYLALDPTYPPRRLEFMLQQAGAGVVVCGDDLPGGLSPRGIGVVRLSDLPSGTAGPPADDPPSPRPGGGNLAYVIYTSGSTGRPKPVGITHSNLIHAYRAWDAVYHLSRERYCFLQAAAVSFDAFAADVVRALCSGGRLVVCPRDLLPAPDGLYRLLRRHGVEFVSLVPAIMRGLLDYLEDTGQSVDFLRVLEVGGEAWYQHDLRRATRLCGPRVRIINAYGLTETTIDSTWLELGTMESPGEGVLPIGRPLAHAEAQILDDHLRPVADGDLGELYIGGPGVGRGYLGRPDLTAERFIPHPCGGRPGLRLYRTGDLAVRAADGTIGFRGRRDGQLKVRGLRIESGEVEAVLVQHPAVLQAAVAVRGEGPDGGRLVGYIVPREAKGQGTAEPGPELRAFAASLLPDYMIPSTFVTLGALPLLSSGKVDRRSLPSPDQGTPAGQDGQPTPRTPTEEALTEIWCRIFGLRHAGRDDDFFALGGHSLLAARLIGQVRRTLGLELPPEAVFECPTPALLAAAIDRGDMERLPQLPPITPVDREQELPLSFSQERAWFIQQLEPGSVAYNTQATLRFKGRLDVEALRRSLEEIVRRHEALRTAFPSVHGRPVQEVRPPWRVDLPVVDLQGRPPGSREAAVRELIERQVRRPFDVTRLPLVRWTLLRPAPEEHILVHSEHHLIHDGWSFQAFLGELCRLYRAFAAGGPSPLAELPVQFADFAVRQRDWMAGEAAREQLDYWVGHLGGAPGELTLPTDYPRPAAQTFGGASPVAEVPPDLSRALRSLSRREGVTLFTTLSAAFQALMHLYTGETDIVVGSGIANRRRPETEGLIGMVINNVVLRTDLGGNPSFRELLARVRRVVLGAHRHQDLPFDRVVEALRPSRSPSRNPLFQVMFSFHDVPPPDLSLPGLVTELDDTLGNGSAKFDLNVIVIPRPPERAGFRLPGTPEGMTLIWEYNTDLFRESTVDRLMRHYCRLLRRVVADPEIRLGEVDLMDDEERRRLLLDWSGRAAEYPRRSCIHDLFRRQSQATPAATAVEFAGLSLSYRQLERRANRLARYLRRIGVGPEVPVGLLLGRSLDMVVATLAVLKAGGVYVPLDPDYPAARLQLMIRDCGADVVLTDRRPPAALRVEGRVVHLDGERDAVAREDGRPPDAGTVPENLACIMYTSGSTGRPKGVCVTHRGVVRLVRGADYARLGPDEVFLQLAPATFDAATFELWGALLNGGRLVVMPPGVPTVQELGEALCRHGVTTLWLTAGLFHLMAEEQPQDLCRVRQILAGGDVLSPAHVRRLLERWGGAGPEGGRLINGYGPTENTTFTCCHPMAAVDAASLGATVPIGRPIANGRVYILDPRLRPVPVGVVGELYAGGDGVARGYLGRPGLTAEQFVPDPVGPGPGGRLYRTGDLCRWLPGGLIEFLGRADGQVKLRGLRVEPGEIEAVLSGHPAVRGAAVVARDDPPGRRLVAYVVLRPEAAGEPADARLRSYLQERLPDYMVPWAFVTLDVLPLTPNGKVDRGALPPPESSPPGADGGRDVPQTPTQRLIARIWARVLGLERVGLHDGLFELGGSSLMATRILSRVRQACGVGLSLRVLFSDPTVAGLAAAVDRAAGREGDAP